MYFDRDKYAMLSRLYPLVGVLALFGFIATVVLLFVSDAMRTSADSQGVSASDVVFAVCIGLTAVCITSLIVIQSKLEDMRVDRDIIDGIVDSLDAFYEKAKENTGDNPESMFFPTGSDTRIFATKRGPGGYTLEVYRGSSSRHVFVVQRYRIDVGEEVDTLVTIDRRPVFKAIANLLQAQACIDDHVSKLDSRLVGSIMGIADIYEK